MASGPLGESPNHLVPSKRPSSDYLPYAGPHSYPPSGSHLPPPQMPNTHAHPHPQTSPYAPGVVPLINGSMDDDDASRSRNAKAQRRHREKRKAHLKALEESVQVLTGQLDDARRQLASGGGSVGGSSRIPMGAHEKDYNQLQAENAYLREENADLRRQLYAFRLNPHLQPPPPHEFPAPEGGAKPESSPVTTQYGLHQPQPHQSHSYGHPAVPSPHRANSGSDRHLGDSMSSTAEGSSGPNSSSNFPPLTGLEHMTPLPRARRGPSASSAPAASPYLPPVNFSDSRDRYQPSQSQSQGPAALRYDAHMFPSPTVQPPPHSLPRSGSSQSQMYQQPSGATSSNSASGSNTEGMYRQDSSSDMWGPESGPPPFSYGMGFGPGPSNSNPPQPGGGSNQPDDWREGGQQ